MLESIRQDLRAVADPEKAKFFPRYFKTGPGQYGEGDQFLGITLPQQHAIAKKYAALPLPELIELLHSPVHEERLTALFIMVKQYKKGDTPTRQQICDLYLKNSSYINNWDLVDASAPGIVGPELDRLGKPALTRLAKSNLLWDRRIAMLSTAHDIKSGRFDRTLHVAEILLHDRHDLIHKAVGWMLREVGKRDLATEVAFLAGRYQTMPRTMLRYAIEKFPPDRRQAYLRGTIRG